MIPGFRDDGWLPSGHYEASWSEVIELFGGTEGSRRSTLTRRLIDLRDVLRSHGVIGMLLLDGSYISDKLEPSDFDVLLIGPSNIQVIKDQDASLSRLLDAQGSEQRGYSLFYIPDDSNALPLLRTLWDISREGVTKGVIEVEI